MANPNGPFETRSGSTSDGDAARLSAEPLGSCGGDGFNEPSSQPVSSREDTEAILANPAQLKHSCAPLVVTIFRLLAALAQ
jgi:hypothetical protein